MLPAWRVDNSEADGLLGSCEAGGMIFVRPYSCLRSVGSYIGKGLTVDMPPSSSYSACWSNASNPLSLSSYSKLCTALLVSSQRCWVASRIYSPLRDTFTVAAHNRSNNLLLMLPLTDGSRRCPAVVTRKRRSEWWPRGPSGEVAYGETGQRAVPAISPVYTAWCRVLSC